MLLEEQQATVTLMVILATIHLVISTGVVSVGEYVELGVEPRRSISLFQVKYSEVK